MVQPLELGLEGGLGFTVCALGFPCPLEVFEVTQHLLLGVSRKSEVSGWYVTGRIFFLSALESEEIKCEEEKGRLKVQKDVGKATLYGVCPPQLG